MVEQPELTKEQTGWFRLHGLQEGYAFTSHGSSRECLQEVIDELYYILIKFDMNKAEFLLQAATDCFESLTELDKELLTNEVGGLIGDEFQALYDIMLSYEDEIAVKCPEGVEFGISEAGGDYGFWIERASGEV